MSEAIKNEETHGNSGRKLKIIGLVTLAVLLVVEAAAAIATELTNDVPMTGETIKTDLAWPWNIGKSVVEDVQRLFENRSDPLYGYPFKGTITADNSITITNLDTIKNISPLPPTPTPKNDVYLLEPVENLDVTSPVEYGMDLAGKGTSSPFGELAKQEAIKNNVKSILLEKNIPAGKVILAPIAGELRYFANDSIPNGTVGGVEIDFTSPDGTEEIISVAGNDISDILSFTPLIEGITPFSGNNKPGDIIYAQVKRGQPIMKSLQAGDIRTESMAQPKIGGSTYIFPTNINLITIPDPKTGKQETVIVADQ
jgi:hypothetical protein